MYLPDLVWENIKICSINDYYYNNRHILKKYKKLQKLLIKLKIDMKSDYGIRGHHEQKYLFDTYYLTKSKVIFIKNRKIRKRLPDTSLNIM